MTTWLRLANLGKMSKQAKQKTALIIGALRGLGPAIVEELLKRGFHVIATCRKGKPTPLHLLAEKHPETLEIETVDITDVNEISALKDRLRGRILDLLFFECRCFG